MLPEIVEAVGDKITVLFDSGIRTGADVIKALSLGAKAVFVGRPPIYGLSIAGKVCCSIRSGVDSGLIPKLAWSKNGPARPPRRPLPVNVNRWNR